MDESNNMTATVDPLDSFRNSTSVMGLSQDFSRFNAQPPSSYNSGGYNSANNNNRHVQWDDSEEEEDEEDDEYIAMDVILNVCKKYEGGGNWRVGMTK